MASSRADGAVKMSKVQMLRALVQQRLIATAEEIFGLFERTIAEYEEELCRSKEKNERQQKLLDAVFNPQLRLHRADVQQLSVVKEEVPPEQQECSSSLDQDPEPPHIKEEQEELWSSQEGEQLQGLEEADITKFTFTPVPVKSEDDEEKPQSSQMETEADGEDCGGPGPDRNSHPDTHVTPETEDKTGDSSEPETDDSDDWTETREPPSGSDSLKDDEVPVSDERCRSVEKPFLCSECGKRFVRKHHLKIHMVTHTAEKPFSCSLCKKTFTQSGSLRSHMRIHTGEKPFSCSVCGKAFRESGNLRRHIKTHTGEKSLSCSFSDQTLTWLYQLKYNQFVGHQSSQLHQSLNEENRDAEPPASSSTDQEDQDPEPPHIKEEQEELWSSQEGEQLQGLEEADITKFTFTPVPVKSEDDEEKPQSSQMETEADGEDCGGPGPDRNSDPDTDLTPETEDKTGDSSVAETDDSDDWTETREPPSGSDSRKDDEVPVSDERCREKLFSCSECGKRFDTSGSLKRHMVTHTGEKPFCCSVCDKYFAWRRSLKNHMRIHTEENPFNCSVCDKRCLSKTDLTRHMLTHTGEKPLSCSVCGKGFIGSGNLKKHMRIHTGEKPFNCPVCGKRFLTKMELSQHVTHHTGETFQFHCL